MKIMPLLRYPYHYNLAKKSPSPSAQQRRNAASPRTLQTALVYVCNDVMSTE